jgi:hypothetical protein
MTADKWLLLPVVLHFFMVFAIGILMGRARIRGARLGQFKRADIINNSKGYPPGILKIGNNFDNQFQLPVSWYACVAFVLITAMTDAVLVGLSWLFLASRLTHAINQTGANTLPNRFYFYLVGYAALAAMWSWFALKYFVLA